MKMIIDLTKDEWDMFERLVSSTFPRYTTSPILVTKDHIKCLMVELMWKGIRYTFASHILDECIKHIELNDMNDVEIKQVLPD